MVNDTFENLPVSVKRLCDPDTPKQSTLLYLIAGAG